MTGKTQKRILVLRYRFIGDTILTIPFLRNLRRAEPDAHIAWVVAPGSSEAIKGVPYVDELIYWDPVTIHADSTGTHATLSSKIAFNRRLRGKRFDKVYVLKRSFSSGIMAWLTGARQRVGFATEGRGFLLTRGVPYQHDRHEVQNFLEVLRADGVPVTDDYLEAWLTPEEQQFADGFFQAAGVAPNELVIGFHPFTANPPRAWHLDNFVDVANALHERYKARIILFGGARDREQAEYLRKRITPAPVMAVGVTSLRQSMALLYRCKLLVCNDSGIMHLAASLSVPLVAVFGPQSPVKFGPWGGKCIVMYEGFPCSPCKQRFFQECTPSPRGKPECIEAITVQKVLESIQTLMPLAAFSYKSALVSQAGESP